MVIAPVHAKEASVPLPPTLDDGFAWAEVDHHFQVVDVSALTVKTQHQYRLKCVRSSRFAIVRYEWTGHGPERPPKVSRPAFAASDEPLVRTLGSPRVHGGSGRYLVLDLGRVYTAGESTSFQVEHFFIDTSQSFSPVMTHLGLEGQERVSINVYLPDGYANTVRAIERFSTDELVGTPTFLKGVQVERSGVHCLHYEYSPPTVTPGRRYGIHWDPSV